MPSILTWPELRLCQGYPLLFWLKDCKLLTQTYFGNLWCQKFSKAISPWMAGNDLNTNEDLKANPSTVCKLLSQIHICYYYLVKVLSQNININATCGRGFWRFRLSTFRTGLLQLASQVKGERNSGKGFLTQPRDGKEGELGEGGEGKGGVLSLGACGRVHVVVRGVELGELCLRAAGVKQGHSEIREIWDAASNHIHREVAAIISLLVLTGKWHCLSGITVTRHVTRWQRRQTLVTIFKLHTMNMQDKWPQLMSFNSKKVLVKIYPRGCLMHF